MAVKEKKCTHKYFGLNCLKSIGYVRCETNGKLLQTEFTPMDIENTKFASIEVPIVPSVGTNLC